ncbi:Hypothetical protein LUCI_2660 [Lucifera butyrica]|uniref:GH26 domain-containing protein n=1 Tax=Lucifera butyrica TaxID=1351585 RepID=A0A498R7Q5_9FIRM|nr:glycosyl hydrolase [Lucifera butyrica]VBB07411.1 Hypothetical protein LUCI_2660 [Lucifera butyrica]
MKLRTVPILLAFWLTMALTPAAVAGNSDITYIVNGYISDNLSATAADDDVKNLKPYNAWLTTYTDYANGYSLNYPSDMVVDVSCSPIRIVFSNTATQMEVYYDDFNNTQTTATDYTDYGNRFLNNTRDHHLELERMLTINGRRVHMLKWWRHKLARVRNDKNYYLSAEIIKNPHEVYTLFIKSSQPIDFDNALQILQSFSLHSKRGQARITKTFMPSVTPLNQETQAFFTKFFGNSSPLRWGIFEPSAPESLQNLDTLEQELDYSFPVVIRYQSLDENLPERGLFNAYEHHKYVELTLQTTHANDVNALGSDSSHSNASIIYDILDGKYDTYFHEYAARLKSFRHPVLFRLDNEMNGDWCWYSAYYASKDTDLYKEVWRYLFNLFKQDGVDNVLWVWNPNDVNRPDFKWNHYLMYYPGDQYVDIIGLTGYNTGTYFPGETWQEFDTIYRPLYAEYTRLFDKPFMITEFGSNSVGGDKPAWIKNMFRQIGHYDQIKLAIWWSGTDYDRNGQPGRIYRLDENENTLAAFRNGLEH